MQRLQVNPTRIELNRCKTRLKAAIKGHKLLKDKSDEMIRQFLSLADDAKKIRQDLDTKLKETTNQFILARALSNIYSLENALETPPLPIKINTKQQSIMGVSVPIIDIAPIENSQVNNSYINTVPQLDDALSSLKPLISLLFNLAQKEKACSLLSIEIEKTRRRVNALEYIMIPQLNETISYIQMKLDENERSALARLMQVKDAIENKE